MKVLDKVYYCINQWISDWEQGKFDAVMWGSNRNLVSHIISFSGGGVSNEKRAETYSHILIKGKLRQEVWYMDDWYQGGILQPEEENENTGDLVINFLHRKHTVELILDENLTKEYDKTLTMLHLYITSEVIECVAMSGEEDPGVMYGI